MRVRVTIFLAEQLKIQVTEQVIRLIHCLKDKDLSVNHHSAATSIGGNTGIVRIAGRKIFSHIYVKGDTINRY